MGSQMMLNILNPGWPSSVRLRFVDGTVRTVPVFGSDGSSLERFFFLFQYCVTERDGSGSASVLDLDGQNRQSPIASVQRTRPTVTNHSAVPRGMNTTPMNANRAIRIAAQ